MCTEHGLAMHVEQLKIAKIRVQIVTLQRQENKKNNMRKRLYNIKVKLLQVLFNTLITVLECIPEIPTLKKSKFKPENFSNKFHFI